jgi:hypothetical protein
MGEIYVMCGKVPVTLTEMQCRGWMTRCQMRKFCSIFHSIFHSTFHSIFQRSDQTSYDILGRSVGISAGNRRKQNHRNKVTGIYYLDGFGSNTRVQTGM